MYNKLLERQLNRFIKNNDSIPIQWKPLLDAISISYDHYEQDHLLGQRSLEISSQEQRQYIVKIQIRMEITHLLLEASSLDQVLPQIISKMSSQFGWDMGCFWLNDPQTMETQLMDISPKDSIPLLAEFIDKYRKIIFPPGNELWSCLKTNSQPYFNNQLQDNPLDEGIGLHKYGVCSYLIILVAFKNRIYGFFELFSRKHMERDNQLMRVFSDIGVEIAMFIERQQAVNRELEMQKKLIEAAREAGKSQIATSVLHNVGNALNTLNTSILIFHDNFKISELDTLSKVADLFKQHSEDLPEFLTKDPRGKYLPDYIISLSKWWTEEKEKLIREFDKLIFNLEHIKKVINSQQRFSTIADVKDKVLINDLIDDVLTLKARDASINSIHIIKEYDELPIIEIDKVKFLQILYNLFCNAIEAVNHANQEPKTITIKTEATHDNKIKIYMIDNGCGIDPADVIKIFSYGFTTKKDGHGFGLHSSALLAQEMHSALQVNSLGVGKGAEFTLTIPIN